jgi:hypothetical protein
MSGYEGHHEDRAKVLNAFGGKKGLIDSGLPSVLFLVVFNISHNLNIAGASALALSALFTSLRLIKRETLQHAISGIAGIAICVLLARHTGKAKDFYLPGLWTNFGYAIGYSLANLVRWPLMGLMLGPMLGENFEWRQDPARLRAYRLAGWLWVSMFCARLIVQYPLYRAGALTALGTARLVMGYPLFIATGWGTWQILKRVPVTQIAGDSADN